MNQSSTRPEIERAHGWGSRAKLQSRDTWPLALWATLCGGALAWVLPLPDAQWRWAAAAGALVSAAGALWFVRRQVAEAGSSALEQRPEPPRWKAMVEQLETAVAQLLRSTTLQERTLDQQSAALQQTQVTAQQIRQTSTTAAATAQSVLGIAAQADELGQAGGEAISRSVEGLSAIRDRVQAIGQRVSELRERTQQVDGVALTVKALADQSNLLALNAAVEAVRAGSHGRGFSVVAREMRGLADQSIEAVARVREILDDIRGGIRKAVESSQHGLQQAEASLNEARAAGQTLRAITSLVTDSSAAVRQIASAVGQQNNGVNEIFSAIAELSQMMDESLGRLKATGAAASDVMQATQRFSASSLDA